MRKAQSGGRDFGPVTTGIWRAFRATLRFEEGPAEDSRPIHELAADFIRSHPAVGFYPAAASEP
jgi:hypothetical protein